MTSNTDKPMTEERREELFDLAMLDALTPEDIVELFDALKAAQRDAEHERLLRSEANRSWQKDLEAAQRELKAERERLDWLEKALMSGWEIKIAEPPQTLIEAIDNARAAMKEGKYGDDST